MSSIIQSNLLQLSNQTFILLISPRFTDKYIAIDWLNDARELWTALACALRL